MTRKAVQLSGFVFLLFLVGLPVAWGDPVTDKCRQQNSAIQTELVQGIQRARATGWLSSSEERQIARIEQRLRGFAAQLEQPGMTPYATLDACRMMTRDLVAARDEVARMPARAMGPAKSAGKKVR